VHKLSYAIVLAAIIAIVSALLGFFVSFQMNLPTGATIVVVEALVFFISFLGAKKRGF